MSDATCAGRTFVWRALLAAVVCLSACESKRATSPGDGTGAGSALADVSTAPATTTHPVGAEEDAPNRAVTPAPTWLVGTWSGTGVSRVNELQMPGNQGVQLSWLKDKGTRHTGAVALSLTFDINGVARGELTGALGELSLRGAWPGQGPLHLEARPDADRTDVFHGTLTVTWDEEAQRGRAELRAASGDGQLLRVADLELERSS